jgi:thiamine pyrophosphate-dependent acetolactate synthase large subunit-like protein
MKKRSGAHILVESLVNEGLVNIFGIPGVDTLSVYDAFLDHPSIKAINVRHEQSAVFMADGYYRASGNIGVALTSGGPGALNTLTAMGTAHNDSSAILHLLNDNPAHVRAKGRGYFHDVRDQYGIFRPVIDFGYQATMPHEIPDSIRTAATALKSRRPKPAMVEIGGDAFKIHSDISIGEKSSSHRRKATDEELNQIVDALYQSKKPMIWSGGGVVHADCSAELIKFAETLNAPVITSQTGKGSIPFDHPLHVGNWSNEKPVREFIDDTDLVIILGSRLSYFPTGGWTLKFPGKVIQIDIDPAELGRNHPVNLGVVSDLGNALGRINTIIDSKKIEFNTAERKPEIKALLDRIHRALGKPVEVEVLDQLRSALPPETIVFNDPTTIVFWMRSYWKTYLPRTWFVPSGFGTLGFALPSAIGAKVARPDVPVVAMHGDAGVMFTIQDLMTAVEHQISVILFVFNDQGYGVERRHQDHLYGRRSGVDIKSPDFVGLAKSFGANAIRVDDLSKVGEAANVALNNVGPTLIEVPCDFKHPGYGSFIDWSKE